MQQPFNHSKLHSLLRYSLSFILLTLNMISRCARGCSSSSRSHSCRPRACIPSISISIWHFFSSFFCACMLAYACAASAQFDAAVSASAAHSISSKVSCQFTPRLLQEAQWSTLQEEAAAATQPSVLVCWYLTPVIKYWHLANQAVLLPLIRWTGCGRRWFWRLLLIGWVQVLSHYSPSGRSAQGLRILWKSCSITIVAFDSSMFFCFLHF